MPGATPTPRPAPTPTGTRATPRGPLTAAQRDLAQSAYGAATTATRSHPWAHRLSDDDLTTCTHEALMRAARTYEPAAGAMTTWVYRVVDYTIRDAVRTAARRRPRELPSATAAIPAPEAAEREALPEWWADRLSPREFAALRMWADGASCEAIAAGLAVRVSTGKTIVHRAKKHAAAIVAARMT